VQVVRNEPDAIQPPARPNPKRPLKEAMNHRYLARTPDPAPGLPPDTGMRKTVLRGLRYLAMVAGAVMAVGVGTMFSPLVRPVDPDASVTFENGRLIGHTSGYVRDIDAKTGTIRVTSSLLGFGAVPVTVSEDTRIQIREKRGAFENLNRFMPVHVIYEIRDTMRLATSIDLMDGAGTAHASTLDLAGRPSESAAAYFYWVEAGIFTESDAADVLMARLLEQQYSVSLDTVSVQPGRPRMLRVQVGPFADEAAATVAQHRREAHRRQASVR
jgi:hypothetical protein